MKTTICIKGIERTTEKAALVNALVNYNDNASKVRQIWMPLSVITINGNEFLEVEGWFLSKLSQQNAFHGYAMNFERPVTLS